MTSASEVKLSEMFVNAREALPQQNALEEMGHPQPPTPMQTDISTSLVVVKNNIQPRFMKAMDMIFHWLCDRDTQKQFVL